MGIKFNPFTSEFDFVGKSTTGPGTGDVVGTPPSDDKAIARYSGTTGKVIQNSKTLVQDGGAIEAQGFITRTNVTDDVTVHAGEAWIAPSLALDVDGSIVMEPDSELIIV